MLNTIHSDNLDTMITDETTFNKCTVDEGDIKDKEQDQGDNFTAQFHEQTQLVEPS